VRTLLTRRRTGKARQQRKLKLTEQDLGGASKGKAAATVPIGPWLWLAVVAALLATAGAAWLLRYDSLTQVAAERSLQQLSVAELLAGHSTSWRLSRLKENPAVMVIEFPGLAEQGAAMNRIAALLEKAAAPRDLVLDDEALSALIARLGDNAQSFYQGHDYTDSGLARFFALAKAQAVSLDPSELRLKRELIAAGLLSELGAAHSEAAGKGPQALITFTAVQPDDPVTPVDETVDAERRASVLTHEASHGRFFTRPAYREHCIHLWREMLSEQQRENIRVYLASIGYDRPNETHMLNEAQAFLMNTADSRAFNAAGIGMTEAELAELRRRFWQTLPPEADGSDKGWWSPTMTRR